MFTRPSESADARAPFSLADGGDPLSPGDPSTAGALGGKIDPVDPTPQAGNIAPTATISAGSFGAIGSEILVNTATAGAQYQQRITALSNGNFVVTWHDDSAGVGGAGGDTSASAIKAQLFAPSGAPIGVEFRVNSATFGSQDLPQITSLTNGGFVVSWQDSAGDASGYAVKAQLYGIDGTRVGNEILVNTATANGQTLPSVTALSGGGFAIAWQDASLGVGGATGDTSDNAIKAQVFAVDGTAVGSEIRANTATGLTQDTPQITALTGGGFVVTWNDFSQGNGGATGDASGLAVKAQVFAAGGAPVGTEIRVNTATTGNQFYSQTAALSNGGFVVTWEDNSAGSGGATGDSTGTAVKAQLFAAGGTPVGTEILVNTATASGQSAPQITSLAGGGFVVTWNDFSQGVGGATGDASSTAVKAQIFTVGGAKVGTEIRVNTAVANSQDTPQITALTNDGFVVTWNDFSQGVGGATGDASSTAVKAQVFSANGTPIGSELRANTATSGDQSAPLVKALAGGGFVVTWTDQSQGVGGAAGDTNGFAVKGQVFGAATPEQTTLDIKGWLTVGDADAGSDSVTATVSADYGTIAATAGTSGAIVSGSGTATVTITGTLAQVNALLTSNGTSTIAYAPPTSDAPATTATLTLGINDNSLNGALMASASMIIGITPVNDASVLTGLDSVTFAENLVNATPQIIDADVAFSDPDLNFSSGMLVVSGALAEDRLAINNQGTSAGQIGVSGANVTYGGTVIGTFSGGSGATLTVTLNSSASAAAVDALIQNLTFADVSDAPTASRTLTVAVTDNGGATTSTPVTVTVTPENDAPSVTVNQSFAATTLVATGSEILVNTATSQDQSGQQVTALSGGGWVVTWQDYSVGIGGATGDSSGPAIKAQVFATGGVKVGTEILVNTATFNNQFAPQITSLSNGGFVVTWADISQSNGGATGDGVGNAVKAQVFAAGGARVGTEIRVNTAIANDQSGAQITALSNGGFVVTWNDSSLGSGGATGDTSGIAVKAQVFAAAGTPVGTEIRVNTATAGDQNLPSLTALSNGGFVVTWTDSSHGVGGATGDTALFAVKAQVFTAGGAATGTEILVNTATASNQSLSQITALSNGGFVVTWEDASQGVGGATGDASSSAVKAQVFAAGGAKVGAEVLVNTAVLNSQSAPVITALSGGGFVVSWTDLSAGVGGATGDGDSQAIKAQVLDATGAMVGSEILVNAATIRAQTAPQIIALASGGFVVAWTDNSVGAGGTTGDNSGLAIKAQIFSATGTRVGSEILADSAVSGDQSVADVAALANGGFVVTWQDASHGTGGATGDTSGTAIKAQVFGGVAAEQAPLNVKGWIILADPDAPAGSFTATISADYGVLNATAGTSGASVSGNGTATLTVTGTLAQINALLTSDGTSTIAYIADTDAPPASATLTIGINDNGGGGGLTAITTTTIGIAAANDAPVLSGLDSVTFAENLVNATPQVIDADVAFSDPDLNFSSGTLVVSGALAEDRVGINNQGTTAGQIGVSGANVTYGGTVIGTFAGGSGAPLTVTLNSSASAAAVDALIQNLTYADVSNTPTASRTLTIAVTDNGGLTTSTPVTVTVTPENDAPGTAVYAGLLGPLGSEIRVNTATSGAQNAQQITGLVGGGFVVTWTDASAGAGGATGDTSGTAVKAQVYAAGGAPVGTEIRVNTATAGGQFGPRITALSDGGFVVTWTDGSSGVGGATGDASGPAVKAQVFGATGTPVGTEILVNTATASSQDTPQITALANGGFVVAWNDSSQGVDGATGDFFSSAVKAQVFAAGGLAVGSEILVNTATASSQYQQQITALANGGFVVTWYDLSDGVDGAPGDTAGGAVKAQVFGADGAVVGTEIRVNTATANSQDTPQITALANGGFVVAWQDQSQGVNGATGDNSFTAVKAQVFAAGGVPVGTEIRVNTATAGNQNTAQITALSNGGFVLTWTDASGGVGGATGDNSSNAVKAQVFAAGGTPVGTEILVNTAISSSQSAAQITALARGGFVVTWQDLSAGTGGATGDNSGTAVKAQIFAAGGTRVGTELLVNSATAGSQDTPQIKALSNGGFVVTWTDASVGVGGATGDTTGTAIKARVYGLVATEQVAYDLKGAVVVSDPDGSAASFTATVSVDYGLLNATAGTSGAIVSGNGTATLTITGTLAQVSAMLTSDATSTISFTADTDTPPASANLTVTTNDGAASGTTITAIAIAGVNDAPTFGGLDAVTFTENLVNATPQLIDTDVTLADPEGNFAGGKVVVSGLLAEDRLGVRDEGNGAGQIGVSNGNVTYGGTLIGTVAGGFGDSLTVVLNGAATVAAVDALVQNLTYADASNAPTASRTLTVAVTDGAGGASSAPITITVTPQDDAPTAAILPVVLGPIGTELLVNTATFGAQSTPQITSLAGGGWVVTWVDSSAGVGGATGDASGTAIKAQVYAAGGAKVGTEILVNTATANSQAVEQITALSNGGFVITWTDASAGVGGATGDASGNAIKAQVFGATGTPVGTEILVNTATSGGQDTQQITALVGGGFVVSWNDGSVGAGGATGDASSTAIKAQAFAADGAKIGTEILVNTATANVQQISQITALANGGFVVSWNDGSLGVGGATGDTANTATKAQVYGAGGAPVGTEIRVNTATTGDQNAQQITALSNGGFVVTWTDASTGAGGATGDNSGTAIKAQVFAAGGTPVGTEIRVNTAIANSQLAAKITALTNGGFVVTWVDGSLGVLGATGDASGTAVKAQVFAAGGTPVGTEIRVNTAVANAQDTTQIKALAGGGFVVTWQDGSLGVLGATGDNNSTATKAQIFAAGGTPVGTEIRVNTAIAGAQSAQQVTALPNGGFVVTWTDASIGVGGATGDTTGTAIKAQVYGLVATEQVASNLKGSLIVVDADGSSGTVTATVSADYGVINATAGTSGAIVTGDGTATLTITGTLAQVTALLVSDATSTISFTANTDTPPTSATLTLAVNDGGTDSTTTAVIGIAAVNDAPTLTGLDAVTFAENLVNAAPQLIDADVVVGDAEGNVAGGKVVVSGLLAEDRLGIRNEGTGAGQIGVSNGNVTYGGTLIGTVAGGFGDSLTVTLNGAATAAAVDALVQNLTYADSSNAPTASRTLTVALSDGAGATSSTPVTIAVTAQDDGPTAAIRPAVFGTIGSEILVNTATANNQLIPVITSLVGGGFVATWIDVSQGVGGATGDTVGQAIKAQVFATGGTMVGTEILVNTATASSQGAPQITALSNGGFVVTWTDPSLGIGGATGDASGNAIKAQVFGAGGAPVGTEILVNTAVAGSQDQSVITALAGGGFVVTWNDASLGVLGAGGDTSSTAVKAQVFGADGTPVGTEIRVNTATTNGQTAMQITGLADGGFVATWTDGSLGVGGATGDASGSAIKAQVYGAGGTPVGTEFRVNTAIANNQDSAQITALAGGGFVVTWRDGSLGVLGATGDNSSTAVKAQVYGAIGTPVGTEIRVNTAIAGAQSAEQITALSNGGFVVTWTDASAGVLGATGDASGLAVKAQIFGATGAKVGTEFLVNTATTGNQNTPQIDALPNGGFVVIWSDDSAGVGGATGDSSGNAVKAQVYGLTATEQVASNLKGSLIVADADGSAGTVTATISTDYGVINATAGTSGASVSGDGTATLVITGTLAQVAALLVSNASSTITFTANTDAPPAAANLTLAVNDGGADSITTAVIVIAAIDDPGTAVADTATTSEASTVSIAVLANDTDGDGPALATVNGTVLTSGQSTTLASGATVKLEANGTLTYDPNGKFNYLVSAPTGTATNAVDTSATDSFGYTINGGSATTVTVTINGVSSSDDQLRGDTSDNGITGTPQADFFNLSQGGSDTVSGGGSNDAFYMGTQLDAGDSIDGGAGTDDQIGLQGNYNYTFGANNLVGIETLAILSGHDTSFGDTSNANYNYNLTTIDANVAAGTTLTVNANNLAAGENLTFNGTAELDGKFLFFAGKGVDSLTGGQQNDAFFFGEGGRLTAADHVDGQGGSDDQLGLRGDYSAQVVFGETTISNLETLAFISASETTFATGGTTYSYNVKLADGNVAAGATLTVSGNNLHVGENMTVDGSAELDGHIRMIAGAGNDVLTGGALGDQFYGRAGQDVMTGGGGNDTFYFVATTDSTTAAMDQIADFTLGDLIDLSRIDADTATGGNQDFTFIDTGAFTSHAGEARITGAGASWTLQVDTDGDGNADMEVAITTTGGHTPTIADFVL